MISYPITANYVADWGLKEAVREIIQNAIDAGDMQIQYNEHSTYISNKGSFNIEALLLGNSVKAQGSIGKYGEGMKLAMLVLARLNIDHAIYSGTLRYKGRFVQREFTEPTLCINYVTEHSYSDDTTVEINKNLKDIIDEVYKPQVEGVVDKDLYVQGLRVCELRGFKYGYNMPRGIVELDRDRRTVDMSVVEDYAAKQMLASKSYAELAQLLFDDCRDVSRLFLITTSSQDKEIGKACAELVAGKRVGYGYSDQSNYVKVGYHFYNFAVNHGGAQKPYSAAAQKLADVIDKHKNKLRRDVKADLLKLLEEL